MNRINHTQSHPFFHLVKCVTATALAFGLVLAFGQSARAGSATWKQNPNSGDWNTATNWTPRTVPNGFSDTATFAASNQTDISLSASVEVNSLVFSGQASSYTTTLPMFVSLTISGTGIVNSSPAVQHFVVSNEQANLTFSGNATAGDQTDFVISGANEGMPGFLQFYGSSTAGTGTFTVGGALGLGGAGGLVVFGGGSAGTSTFTIEGSEFSGPQPASVQFAGGSAGNATIIAQGGTGAGGSVQFFGGDGGNSRIVLFGNGNLDLFQTGFASVGSIEGDGIVFLASASLLVGANNLSTNFTGTIQDSGALTKIGTGTLTLNGLNTYSGGTTIEAGSLSATTKGASATGTGPVQVNAGTLGGTSRLSGTITMGTGIGTGAFLAPGVNGTGTLTTRSRVTFNADSTYVCELSTTKRRADQISAKGITIQTGAMFSFTALGNRALASGTSFTVINNTARQLISGEFSNLADGSIFTVGPNTYAVNYEGGTGNDLTLVIQ